ncbi:MAG: hypothetical protein ACI9MR_000831 [Myxococcota bacterium]|jgi:hypothetical protein
MLAWRLALVFFVLPLVGVGCDDAATDGGGDCPTTQRPIVFAHGFLASGDTWALQTQRFHANGFCRERMVIFDWNTLTDAEASVGLLDAAIDKALVHSGASTVDLVGHSRGGSLGYIYLSDPVRAAKVAHYAHVASGLQTGPAGPVTDPVPTLNIWSDGDLIISEKGPIPGATDASLPGLDHYQVATAPGAFKALYTFFVGSPPATTDIAPTDPVEISGRALRLGENSVPEGAVVSVFEVDPATGTRLTTEPAGSWTIGPDGHWGPYAPTPGASIELFMTGPTDSDVPTHTYRTPFLATTEQVYLRALPTGGSLVGTLLGTIPRDDASATHIVFLASQAAIVGRDTLFAGARELSVTEFASPEQTSIAFFLFDAETDGQDGGAVGLFGALNAFIAGIDTFFDASGSTSTTFTFNGESQTVPNWPSDRDGFSVVVFE